MSENQNENSAPEIDGNLIIHGDNLHALKALLPRYAGRVKCIYIDPPYNTGNEGWVYNDKVNSPLMQEWLKQNSPVDGEDLERHEKWLCMLWPRLHLLKELLADDGAIFVSIDDNEQHHLRMLMDEIFGEQNFVSLFAWWSKFTLANDAKRVSNQHESILCYAKTFDNFIVRNLPRTEEMNKAYKNPDDDPKGRWMASPLHAKSGKESDRYSLTFPNGVTWECPIGRFPAFKKETLLELYQGGEIWFGKAGNSTPHKKTYLSEVRQGKTVGSLWEHREVGHTASARVAIKEIFSDYEEPFDNPKPVGVIDRILRIATGPDDIVLDSFAGSGTTGHAVLALNQEDGGNRKFILVECEDYADTITAERVRRVIRGVPAARDKSLREGLGGSFTYCTLGEPVDLEKMLTGEALPSYAMLAAYLLHTGAGLSAEGELRAQNGDGLFYSGEAQDYYLIYQPELEWLRSNAAMLQEETAKRIGAAARANDKTAVVFAAGKQLGQRELTQWGITFCQLPYEIYRGGAGSVV